MLWGPGSWKRKSQFDVVRLDTLLQRCQRSRDLIQLREDITATIKRFCLKSLEIAAAQTEIARHSESGH
jgi:hypothetical protein